MSDSSSVSLPKGFEDLEHLVDYWAGIDVEDRWDRRARAPMEEIRAFYDTMVARTDAILKYLEPKDISNLDAADSRLFRLVLSLAHAAMAVELHGQPRAPNSPFPHKITVPLGPRPFA